MSLPQLKVMSAIENCRTAALGGHVEACEDCGQRRIAYNSCRNGIAQSAGARRHGHGLPNARPICFRSATSTSYSPAGRGRRQNKALVYDLLFKAASETMLTIAADRKLIVACDTEN